MKLKMLFLMCSLSAAFLVSGKTFETDKFTTKNGVELVITFIKHGSLQLTFNGRHIQIDPVSEYADYNSFPKADIILITHEHGDHLDPKAISALEKTGTLLITNEAGSKNSNIDVRIREMQ